MARITEAEKDRRVDLIARMINEGHASSECVQYAANEWGIKKRQADAYLADARALIRSDMSMERVDFLASKLRQMEAVYKKAMQSNQMGAAIGAARLQAELTQLL